MELKISEAMKSGIKDVMIQKLNYSDEYKSGVDLITEQILEDQSLPNIDKITDVYYH